MNALSLFSGIGGLDLAAEWAGFKTVAFCEQDKFCHKVLAKHWPGVKIYDNVRTLDASELPRIELLHGGYPCQPFSTAGSRKGQSDERNLWPAMFSIVKQLRPTWVVAENVKGHITLGLDSVLDDLEGAGYATQTYCIPACAIGAVHRRERLFILAYSTSDGRDEGKTPSGDVSPNDVWREKGKDEDCKHERCSGVRPILEWGGREVGAWGAEPPEIRVDDGLPNRVDRNRVIGNAVSPQQAYPIFAAIAETYNAEITGGEAVRVD
jgi:DNA (cytosine-5)-methyltransferase 1